MAKLLNTLLSVATTALKEAKSEEIIRKHPDNSSILGYADEEFLDDVDDNEDDNEDDDAPTYEELYGWQTAEWYDDHPLMKPVCCRTCGGHYPDCRWSCAIFDE